MYVPTTSYDDNKGETFYDQLQEILKDILIVQGDWNAKTGKEAPEDWDGSCGEHCNTETNDRGLRLLEFASANDLLLANTFGPHKT